MSGPQRCTEVESQGRGTGRETPCFPFHRAVRSVAAEALGRGLPEGREDLSGCPHWCLQGQMHTQPGSSAQAPAPQHSRDRPGPRRPKKGRPLPGRGRQASEVIPGPHPTKPGEDKVAPGCVSHPLNSGTWGGAQGERDPRGCSGKLEPWGRPSLRPAEARFALWLW